MPSTAPKSHVALLRGINVGGRNKLPMKVLAGIFEAQGASDVRTYIQSGNVVFNVSAAVAKTLAAKVEAQIEDELSLRVPVVLRTRSALRRAVSANPFAGEPFNPKLMHIMFLATKPSAAHTKGLDPERSPGDRFALKGKHLYVSYGAGVAKSKLTNAWLDRTLNTTCTGRNWTTCEKLVALTAGDA